MAANNQKIISKILIGLVRSYQLAISPFFAASCRYQPTCSKYACEAISQHGPLNGLILTIKRIARCHPFGNYGFDPVPKQKERKS